MTVRTSSIGSMALTRSCEVRHSRSMFSRSPRRASPRSAAPVRGSSRIVSSSLMRRSTATTARRRASVGCAVSTRCTRRESSRSSRCPGPVSRLSSVTAAASDSRTGSGPPSRSRSSRMRWCSSARLVRWKYTVKARATCSARSRSQEPTRAAIASPAGSARRSWSRASITACRSRSTSASRSGPVFGSESRMTSPRMSPSSRTSRRIRSGSSARSRARSLLTVRA